MTSNFKSRIRKTILVAMIPVLIILPPFILPPMRSVYAPAYDHIVLPVIGYGWKLYYPYSAMLLVPLAVFLAGLWLSWLFHIQFLSVAQRRLTAFYFRIQPEADAYRVVKRMQLILIAAAARVKMPYRGWFPLSGIPVKYAASSVSRYMITVYELVMQIWVIKYQLTSDVASRDRIIQAYRGIAGIYAPSLTHLDEVDTPNLVQAMTHLDNAQIYGARNWMAIRTIFQVYLHRTAGLNADLLTLHQILHLLKSDTAIDRMILLRMLINLWFESPSPAISRIVIGRVSEYLEQADLMIDARLSSDQSPANQLIPAKLSMRGFAERYLYFVEKCRGPGATIHIRDMLETLSRKAHFLEDTDQLAEEFRDLLVDASGVQQAADWQARYPALNAFRETADEAILTALYRTGRPESFKLKSLTDPG